jgi:hypothetical protein
VSNKFYFSKTNSWKHWEQIPKAKTLDKAEEYVKAYILVNCLRNKFSEYTIITEDEYNNILLEEKKTQCKNLKLDERAISVFIKLIGPLLGCDYPEKSHVIIFGLNKGSDKPYYAYCYWGNDSNGFFCDEKDLIDLYKDKLIRSNDEAYDITVYDVETLKEVKVITEVKVHLNGKELFNYYK